MRCTLPLAVLFSLLCMSAQAALLEQVKMVSSSSGWAFGTGQGRSVVLRTSDGGRHWRDASPAGRDFRVNVSGANSDATTNDALFAAAGQAWIAGASSPENAKPVSLYVWHTLDNGRRWSESKFPAHNDMVGDSLSLSFSDARHGALLALGGPSAGLMPKEFYTTADGGRTWRHMTSPDSASIGAYYPTGVRQRGVQEAWIAATYHGKPDAPFLHTTDGGRTWRQQQLPIPALYRRGGYANTYPPQFFGPDARLGYMMASLVDHTSRQGDINAGGLFLTRNGGRQWQLLRVFRGIATSDALEWSFTDTRHGWVLDPAGECLFATQDGGRTWQRLAANLRMWGAESVQLDFVSSRTGWALVMTTGQDRQRSSLYQTNDGGRHWRRINTESAPEQYQ